jgi:hypothetical protein
VGRLYLSEATLSVVPVSLRCALMSTGVLSSDSKTFVFELDMIHVISPRLQTVMYFMVTSRAIFAMCVIQDGM